MVPPRPPAARPPRGPSPGRIARRLLTQGALAPRRFSRGIESARARDVAPCGRVRCPETNRPAAAWPSSFEVAPVLLWGPSRCAGAPAPSGCPSLRYGCHACSSPRPRRRHEREVGLRPSPFRSSLPLLTSAKEGEVGADVTGQHTSPAQRREPPRWSDADSHDAARRGSTRCSSQSPCDRTGPRARIRKALDAG